MNRHAQEARKHPELSGKVVLGWGREDRGRNKLVGQVKRNAHEGWKTTAMCHHKKKKKKGLRKEKG